MKTLDSRLMILVSCENFRFRIPVQTSVCSQPKFLSLTKDLIKGLSSLSSDEVSKLMNISPKLADLNKERFQQWEHKHDQKTPNRQSLPLREMFMKDYVPGI